MKVPDVRHLRTVGRDLWSNVAQNVRAEVEIGADINEVLNEIKAKVDAISTFPELTEKPVVYKVEIPTGILFVSIYL